MLSDMVKQMIGKEIMSKYKEVMKATYDNGFSISADADIDLLLNVVDLQFERYIFWYIFWYYIIFYIMYNVDYCIWWFVLCYSLWYLML